MLLPVMSAHESRSWQHTVSIMVLCVLLNTPVLAVINSTMHHLLSSHVESISAAGLIPAVKATEHLQIVDLCLMSFTTERWEAQDWTPK